MAHKNCSNAHLFVFGMMAGIEKLSCHMWCPDNQFPVYISSTTEQTACNDRIAKGHIGRARRNVLTYISPQIYRLNAGLKDCHQSICRHDTGFVN